MLRSDTSSEATGTDYRFLDTTAAMAMLASGSVKIWVLSLGMSLIPFDCNGSTIPI